MIVTARVRFDDDNDGREFMNCLDQWITACEWAVTSSEIYQEGAE